MRDIREAVVFLENAAATISMRRSVIMALSYISHVHGALFRKEHFFGRGVIRVRESFYIFFTCIASNYVNMEKRVSRKVYFCKKLWRNSVRDSREFHRNSVVVSL